MDNRFSQLLGLIVTTAGLVSAHTASTAELTNLTVEETLNIFKVVTNAEDRNSLNEILKTKSGNSLTTKQYEKLIQIAKIAAGNINKGDKQYS